MASISNAFTPNGHARVQAIWTLSAKQVEENTCEYTTEFMDFIAKHSITFGQAAQARQHDGGDHNRRETALFAASIERKALRRLHHTA